MKNFLLLLIFLFTAFASAAQGYDPNKVNKKAVAFYNQAIEQAQSGKFAEGIALLDKAIQADAKFVDAYLSKAGMYGEMKDYMKSIATITNFPIPLTSPGLEILKKRLKQLMILLWIPN
jgi:Tfp pilus assembly protein PilF